MFDELLKRINDAKKIAIFNHEHPDGDALGSAYALKLALCNMGKQAEVFLRDGDEQAREFAVVKGTEPIGLSVEECDMKIAVDCADLYRIGELSDVFGGNTAAIDHHVTHKEFADITVLVPSAPATGEVVFDFIKAAGIELNSDIATNLYLAIACDTGNFKYSSTTPKTHITAAELMGAGIDFAGISKWIFDTKSIEYLKAYKMGIEHIEMYADGQIAVLAFSEEDFSALGINETQVDGIVALPSCIEGVTVGAYIRQRGENEFKVSLRSNTNLDVAKIAVEFGGGGHMKASGFNLKMPMAEVKRTVVSAIENTMAQE